MPGTTDHSMPAASTASISSSRRPNTVGSPDLRRTTSGAAGGVADDQRVDLVLRRGGAEPLLAGVDDHRLAPGELEDRGRDEPVVDHHVGRGRARGAP